MHLNHSLRTEVTRAGLRAVRVVLRCGALLILISAAYSAAYSAYVDWLSRGATVTDRELAVYLAETPVTLERLAQKHEETGSDPLGALRRAAALEPQNPERWIRLGNVAEWSGDEILAGKCFHKAADLSQLYRPRYLLAEYYFRRQDQRAFAQWVQNALQKSYGDVSPLLDLSHHMQPGGEWFVRQALASPVRLHRQFLAYLVRRGELVAAAPIVDALADTASNEDLGSLYSYCDLALSHGDASAAETVWNALCRRGRIPYHSLDAATGASLTNGDFERLALGTAFDWHVESVNGIRIEQRAGEWRAEFSGEEPESCLFAWQYVPLVIGRQYRVRISTVTLDGVSADGIGWSLFYASPDGVWKEWIPGSDAPFTAEATIARLALTYRRPIGAARLLGTVALRGIQLEMSR